MCQGLVLYDLPQGGVQDPLHLKWWLLASVAVFPSLSKNSFRRKRLAKSSMSACISDHALWCWNKSSSAKKQFDFSF